MKTGQLQIRSMLATTIRDFQSDEETIGAPHESAAPPHIDNKFPFDCHIVISDADIIDLAAFRHDPGH